MSLHAVPDHLLSRVTVADPVEPRSETAIKLLFGIEDVATTASALEGLGAQLVETITNDVWDVIDPEGDIIRIQSR